MRAWVVIVRRHRRQLGRSAWYAYLFAFQPLRYRRSVTLLESTLVEMPASVDSKLLTQALSPLAATLTKNPGEGGQLLLTKNRIRLQSLELPQRGRRMETNVPAVRPNR